MARNRANAALAAVICPGLRSSLNPLLSGLKFLRLGTCNAGYHTARRAVLQVRAADLTAATNAIKSTGQRVRDISALCLIDWRAGQQLASAPQSADEITRGVHEVKRCKESSSFRRYADYWLLQDIKKAENGRGPKTRQRVDKKSRSTAREKQLRASDSSDEKI